MENRKSRALIVIQDSGFSGIGKLLETDLVAAGFDVRLQPSSDVRVPDFNAADILLFFLKPSPEPLIEYGRAFDSFSGMNCAGRLGGILSSGPSRLLEALQDALAEAGMTLVEPLYLRNFDISGTGELQALESWTAGLLTTYKDMIHARRSYSR